MLVGSLILAINFAPVPDEGTLALGLVVDRRRRRDRVHHAPAAGAEPAVRPRVAGARIFWVAACAGIIVFGSLMGAMFIGQQFLQNVLGYGRSSGAAILPAASAWSWSRRVRPSSSNPRARGSRCSLGYVFVLLGFAHDVAVVGGEHRLLEGRASATRSSVPALGSRAPGLALADRLGAGHARRYGFGTADLQRDLGGAIMQSIFGALLTAGYAAAVADRYRGLPDGDQVTARPEH